MDAADDAPRRNAPSPGPADASARPPRRGPLRLLWRTVVKSWKDGVLGKSAEAAFWQTLALPPLLLGLLGSLGYVVAWFGTATIAQVEQEILRFSRTIFTDDVVDQIIDPTINDVLSQGRGAIVSFGFVLSLWAGSSGLATLVDAITQAHGQYTVRNYLWQRTFSVLLYLVALVGAVLVLPLLAIGPGLVPQLFPASVGATVAELVTVFYYPTLGILIVLGLATLYKVALPRKHAWHRGLPGALLAMAVFLASSAVLRFYIRWVTSTGYTYGALATPIALLLFSFFLALAILLGAQFNHAIHVMWPARMTRRQRRRWRRLAMDRRAARTELDTERSGWRGDGGDGGDRGDRGDEPRLTAPSPADTTGTLRLPRMGGQDSDGGRGGVGAQGSDERPSTSRPDVTRRP
ncbi:MAG: YihY/virulence factor BrkB family protein [Pseudonocardiaceae bacterium]|nr:YihY/virulence factor BrkB family protein [Pseudonocardiaceae bacterium]